MNISLQNVLPYPNFQLLKANKPEKPKLSFGRSMEEHLKDLGANYDAKTGKTKISIWTMPSHVDYKKGVTLEVIPFKNCVNQPLLNIAKNIDFNVPMDLKKKGSVLNFPMQLRTGNNEIFEIESDKIKPGSFYRFIFNNNKGELIKANDPRAYYLPYGLNGWASVVDDSKYKFKYERPKFSNSEPILIYEMNINTATKEGTFEKAKNKLYEISKMGFNTIQVMPVGQAYGRGWGYDSRPFSVSKELCGDKSPDELKKFVDEAHKNNLKVIMDININHIVPDRFPGNLFAQYSYMGDKSPWGDHYNYNDRNIRNFALDSLIRYAKIYNVDGFRLDSINSMSNGILREIGLEFKSHNKFAKDLPEIIELGEDYQLKSSTTEQIPLCEIKEFYKNPDMYDFENNNNNPILGLDAVLNLDSERLTGNIILRKKTRRQDDAYVSNLRQIHHQGKYKGNYQYGQLTKLDNLVWALSTHDHLLNASGARLTTLSLVSLLKLIERMGVDGEEHFKLREAARVADSLMLSYKQSKENSILSAEKQNKLGIKPGKEIKLEEFKEAYQKGKQIYKATVTNFLLYPGKYKIMYQGDEKGVTSPNLFYADHEDKKIVNNTSINAGYNTSPEYALKLSNLEQEYKNEDEKTKMFFKSIMAFFKSNGAFLYRWDPNIKVNDKDNIFEISYTKEKNGIYALLNIEDKDFPNYIIQLPKGKWIEKINSRSPAFDESPSELINENKIFDSTQKLDDFGNTTIKLPARSAVIFEKIGDA